MGNLVDGDTRNVLCATCSGYMQRHQFLSTHCMLLGQCSRLEVTWKW